MGNRLITIQSEKLSAIIFIITDRYFQAGGIHEDMVKLLSENYTGIAQSTNLLANWLIVTGKLISIMLM